MYIQADHLHCLTTIGPPTDMQMGKQLKLSHVPNMPSLIKSSSSLYVCIPIVPSGLGPVWSFTTQSRELPLNIETHVHQNVPGQWVSVMVAMRGSTYGLITISYFQTFRRFNLLLLAKPLLENERWGCVRKVHNYSLIPKDRKAHHHCAKQPHASRESLPIEQCVHM